MSVYDKINLSPEVMDMIQNAWQNAEFDAGFFIILFFHGGFLLWVLLSLLYFKLF